LEHLLTTTAFVIRRATRDDVSDLHAMIAALARYEELSHLCVASEADLADALFGPHPVAEALIARSGAEAAGFALFFHTYSTFLGRRSLWLEDLFVQPAHRRKGCARLLLSRLAELAVQRNCGRFEWAVLDWNAQAIAFYQGLGATVLPDWRIVRMVGPALASFAAGTDGGSRPD
jgi:GNAT superfamily N-acetyltransferase